MIKILNARIDMRLIHGQVATMWCRSMPVNRIMVIDDEIINDPINKTALKMACPVGVKLSILNCVSAAENLLNGKYMDDQIFMVAKSPLVYKKMAEQGFLPEKITVGNMSGRENAKQIIKTVAVTEEEKAAFLQLSEWGAEIEYRLAPRDTPLDFIDLLKK